MYLLVLLLVFSVRFGSGMAVARSGEECLSVVREAVDTSAFGCVIGYPKYCATGRKYVNLAVQE